MASLLAVFALASLLSECTCFSLVVDIPYKIVPPGKVVEKFMCQTKVPLTGCQVMNLQCKKIYNLSNGSLSPFYWGAGLENGQCGFVLEKTVTDNMHSNYGCRARAHGSAWEYQTFALEHSGYNAILPVHTGPRSVIADPGSNVTLEFAAGEALSSCFFKWKNHDWTSSGSSKDFSIDDSELKQKRCSLTLVNVQSETSGIFTTSLRSTITNGTLRKYMQLTTIIVKMAPRTAALSLNNADGLYYDRETLEASCIVGPARPEAQISWLLDDVVIQGQDENFDKLPWEYEAVSSTRNLSRKLSTGDDGKELVCRVRHIALPGGVLVARRRLTVRRVVTTEEPGFTASSSSPDSSFLTSPDGNWLMVGVGASLLLVAVVVAALLVYACTTKKWCYSRRGLTANPASHAEEQPSRGRSIVTFGTNRQSYAVNDAFEMYSTSVNDNIPEYAVVY